jgi:hypothetical protein
VLVGSFEQQVEGVVTANRALQRTPLARRR